MNHEKIRKSSERITKIKPFINKLNWEVIYFLSEKRFFFFDSKEGIALNHLWRFYEMVSYFGNPESNECFIS